MTNGIAIIYGGRSVEHEWSVKMLANLEQEVHADLKHRFRIAIVFYIGLDNLIYVYEPMQRCPHDYVVKYGQRYPLFKLGELLCRTGKFVFSLLQGTDGEDGRIQGLGSLLSIPSSFGSVTAAAISQDKSLLSEFAAGACDELTPVPSLYLPTSAPKEGAEAIFTKFGSNEIVVKPNSLGGSFRTRTFIGSDHEVVEEHIRGLEAFDTHCLAQQRIGGDEIACGVMFRAGEASALPPARIISDRGFLGEAEKK